MVHEHAHPAPPEKQVRRALLITLALNLLVAGTKGVYGLAVGSLAIASDGLHSLLDAGANINAQNLSFGGGGGTTSSPFRVIVYESARNRDADYQVMVNTEFRSTSANSELSYQTEFARFLRVSAEFEAEHDDYSAILLTALADRLAELIPPDAEVAMGEQMTDQFASLFTGGGEPRFCSTPAGDRALAEMTARLAGAAETHVPLTVRVLDSDVTNAFALPGGQVFEMLALPEK